MLRKVISLTSVVILVAAGLCGCSKTSAAPKVPYVPPDYFNSTEVIPKVLCDAYFSRYANVSIASLQFDGLYFVFKNLQITSLMLNTVDKGYILADNLIQCDCTNISVLKQYKIGDKIDVVVKDKGVVMDVPGGLEFTDCIIIPPDSVQLPAPGSGVVIPTY